MAGQFANRGVYVDEVSLPYQVFDADHHIYPPSDARIRHLPQKYHADVGGDRGGFAVPDPEGELEGMDDESIANDDRHPPGARGRFRWCRLEGAPTDGALWRAAPSRSPGPC